MAGKKKKKLKLEDLTQLAAFKKLRKFWSISPVTKIKKGKNKESRAKEKEKLRKELKDY